MICSYLKGVEKILWKRKLLKEKQKEIRKKKKKKNEGKRAANTTNK